MGKNDGLIILAVIGIPVVAVVADMTVLKGKLGISSMLCSTFKVGCGTAVNQRVEQQTGRVQQAVAGLPDIYKNEPELLGSRFLQPQSNYVRITLSS